MAAHTFEASSAGIGSRRLDDDFPSDSANSPEERRDTSPSASLSLAASTPARLSQQSKTRLRTTLRDSPARPGHSDTRTGLFGRFSPARDWSTVRRRAPSYHALRARDLDDEDDQDVPAFTPLPPPRLFVPQGPLRPGQLFREDRASSLIPSRPRVSPQPTAWSPLFRARQHYPPTKAELTSAFETSRPHDYEFEPGSRVEAWLENVRPDRFEATHVSSSLRDLHLNRDRSDGIVEPDVHHATPRGALPSFEAPEGGQTQLPPCSPQQHFSPSPIRGYPRIHRPPSAIPVPQTPLTHHHHHHHHHHHRCHLIPHTTTSPTHPRHRRPGTAFSLPPAPSAPEDDNDPRRYRSDHASASTSAASLSSPSRDSVPPQPCITLSPPPSQQQQQQRLTSSPGHDQYRGHVAARVVHPSPPSPPLLYSRRRPRQRVPAPAPAPAVVTMPTTGDAGHVPVTPKKAAAPAAAGKNRFGDGGDGDGHDGGGGGGGGEDDGRAEESMLSPDVYLWRGDSERRARFREMIRQRCASYGDKDIGDVEEGGG